MKIHKLDLLILELFICQNSNYTSTDITKQLFKNLNRHNLIKKNSLINYHLKKLIKYQLLNFTTDSKNTKQYLLNLDKVVYGNSKLSVDGKTIDMGYAFFIESNEGSYLINFLNNC